jgi:hypothetical protein
MARLTDARLSSYAAQQLNTCDSDVDQDEYPAFIDVERLLHGERQPALNPAKTTCESHLDRQL